MPPAGDAGTPDGTHSPGDRTGDDGLVRPGDDGPIRRYRPTDRADLYQVCLRTGDSGWDATGRIDQPALLGDVFVGPYLQRHPELAFVVADATGRAGGYVLGALDSEVFARWCAQQWWPLLRERYRDGDRDSQRMDGWLLRWIDTPPPVPRFAARYPSHLHIDLLPGWQSGGWGRRLIERLLTELRDRGSPGVHLGVSPDNERAIGFYRHLGFVDLGYDDGAVWWGLSLSQR